MKKHKIQLTAIDIGNTTLSFGVFENKRLVRQGRIGLSDIQKKCHTLLKGSSKFECVFIISSVVPEATKKLEWFLNKKVARKQIFVVGKNIYPKIRMQYDRKNLGVDRLVNVYGALKSYKLPALVIDFGTAITFDYISEKGVFEGGLIVPGVETSGRALCQRAVLLKHLFKMRPIRSFIGRNSHSAFLSGLLNGFGVLADGLIERFRGFGRHKMTVLVTGGFARIIAPYVREIDYLDPLHTLKSLASIYYDEVEKAQ